MGDGSHVTKKEIETKLEKMRGELETDVQARSREAKEKLDELLSDSKMEFCSRCGRKVNSRTDWSGKCIWEDCKNLICSECWDVSKYRFCSRHSKSIVDEKSEQPTKKEIYAEEDDSEINVDLKGLLDEHDETRRSKLVFAASEYARWLKKRMEKNGAIDWTPTRYIEKARMRMKKKGEEHVFEVYTKRWFMKKVHLSIVIAPYDVRREFDKHDLNAYIHKAARKNSGYVLIVLVSDGSRLEATTYINRFSDTSFSLYLVEPKKGYLNFNINDSIASGYSGWFNQKKEPSQFRERLNKMGEVVSGRVIVSEKAVSKDFGFSEKEAHHILSSCRFLDHIDETDTFILKKER
ncbi:MAG: hypothetical protein JW789_04875 [Candidatus Aenigmarchaeota archaeon]|nr:hypothetical protein [Candidatus Aenigmarchaeota archaeon]